MFDRSRHRPVATVAAAAVASMAAATAIAAEDISFDVRAVIFLVSRFSLLVDRDRNRVVNERMNESSA